MKKPDFINNTEKMEAYAEYLELQGKKESTINVNLWQLSPFFEYVGNKKAEDITEGDITKFVLKLKKEVKAGQRKECTFNNTVLSIRTFFKWLKPDNNFFKNIKIRNPKPDTSKKEWTTRKDVVALMPYCNSQRDRAFVFFMWESGARISEILDMNVEDFKIDKYGAVATVEGKTGKRSVRVIDCVPDLQLYLNQRNAKVNEPLFLKNNGERFTKRGAQSLLDRLEKRSGSTKNLHPHSFRHGRLTELSNMGLSEMQLRILAGWTRGSDMPAVYITPTEYDIEKKLLSFAGIEIEDDIKEIIEMKNKICPRCQTSNPFDAQYCRTCSMILDPIIAQRLEEKEKVEKEDVKKQLEELTKMVDALWAGKNGTEEGLQLAGLVKKVHPHRIILLPDDSNGECTEE